jgi:amino acid adenylation domain-containing protein
MDVRPGQLPGPPSVLPLSREQRRLLFLHELDPGGSAYNVFVAVRLRGLLSVTALRRALDQTVQRHEMLRTTFVSGSADSEPRQRVGPARPVPLPVTDLAGGSDTAVADLVTRWSREPFDLARGPVIRAKLVRLGPREHVFGLFMHHIVCDGRSLSVLFAELADFYAGRERPAPPMRYGDHVVAQDAELREGPFAGGLGWWRDQLTGAPFLLELPADRFARAGGTRAGATYTRRLPAGLVRRAAALGRRHRASVFMVSLAAYGALLGRITGAREVLVGVPVEGRLRPELEQVVGLFVNTLPLRIDLGGDPSFAELIDRVRAHALGAYDHQEVPFDLLVEELRPERSPGRPPLVQTMFTFESGPPAEPHFAGLAAELLRVEPTAAKFDLDMTIQADARGHRLRTTYATGRFDAGTAAALTDGYACLLHAAVAAPDTPIGRLPLLDPAARSALVTRARVPGPAADALLPALLAGRAAATPGAPAVDGAGGPLTYAELDAAANRLAHHLRDLGAGPEDVVGVCLPRGQDLLIAMLAVLKTGAAYLPLDPDLPPARRKWMCSASRARIVLTTDHVRRAGKDLSARSAAPVRIHPESLAYVIFTSGSTGEPKPVAVPHRALANHARAIADRYGIGPADRVLQFANAGFDVAAEEIFPTWVGGGCVVLPGAAPPSPEALSELVAAERITVVNLPSGHWRHWVTSADHQIPGGLRLAVIGSEPVDPAAAARWTRTLAPGVRLLNAYGVSEATITTTLHPIAGETDRPVPIGRPLAGTVAFVLDENLEPVPTGVPGELYVGGAGVARGYLHRPGLTAEQFVPDPFGDDGSGGEGGREFKGGRLYRTGDCVRRRADDAIEFLGRLDDQLNVRGHRVEPGEVTAALRAHPAVRDAAVAVVDGELVGYLVPAVPADLRAHLARWLPSHLIPEVFAALDVLPVGPNGKLDGAALPKPAREPAAARTPPGSPLERRLAGIWRQLLGVADVGIDDNFFDLGGRSRLLVAVRARIADELGVDLPLVALYEAPTIAALARRLDGDAVPPTGEAGAGTERAARLQGGLERLRRRRELLRERDGGAK